MQTLIIHKTCEVYSLGSLKNLPRFSVAFISTYQTEFPPSFVASSLYRGSCLPKTTGQCLPFKSVHRTILGSLSLLGLVILDGVHIKIHDKVEMQHYVELEDMLHMAIK
jgi:hypothetical protein